MAIWWLALGCGGVLVSSIGSRIMRERSLRLLTAEQKVLLLDAFSRNRVIYPSVAVGIAILYVLTVALGAPLAAGFLWAFLLPVVLLLAWSHVRIMMKLKALELPEAYRRVFNLGRLLGYCGLVFFLACFVAWIVTSR